MTTVKRNLKEALSGGFMGMIENEPQQETPAIEKPVKKASKKEEKEIVETDIEEIRITLMMPKKLHKKIKIMAHWELTTLKEIINNSLTKTVKEYENSHGELQHVPKSKK